MKLTSYACVLDTIRGSQCECRNRQGRVSGPAGRKRAAPNDKEIRMIERPAPAVDHRRRAVAAHPAGAHNMPRSTDRADRAGDPTRKGENFRHRIKRLVE